MKSECNLMMFNNSKITITNYYPTTITTDFLEFLHYIENHKVTLTKTTQQIARKDLVAMYALMPEPKLEVNEKSNQIGYPLLHLFFQLAIKLELIQKRASGSTSVAAIHEENLALFKTMTTSEQYVSLLDCFWMHADWRELQGGRYHREPYTIKSLFTYLEQFPIHNKVVISKDRELSNLLYDYGYFLLYFSYFGLWQVVLDEEERKDNHYRAKTIELQPLFKQLADALTEAFEFRMDNEDSMGGLDSFFGLFNFGFEEDDDDDELEPEQDEEPEKSLFALLQPLFEEGQLTTIFQKVEKHIVAGEYVLKVSLNSSCWRTMQVSEAHTLLDVHNLIQQAFDFADDHLYAFYMDGKRFSKNCYNSPMSDRGPFVSDVEIGELHLYEGQRILYLFDFGDEWEFTVDVIKITEGKECKEPCILQSKGDSPDQYAW